MLFFLFIKVTNNYYQKHKERLVKKVREKYQNYSEKEKGKRWKKTRENYQNFTVAEKEKKCQYDLKRNKNLCDE